jgi:KDO2-lipid IV(A) lauroyltransferase
VAETFGSYGGTGSSSSVWPTARDARDRHRGFDHVTAGIERGSGVILALPHVGDGTSPAWLATQGLPPTVVAEPVEPPDLFEWFAGVRRALGMTVVQLGPDAGRVVLQALRNNQVVCLLLRPRHRRRRIEVEFFGTPRARRPATLALRTERRFRGGGVLRSQGGHHAVGCRPFRRSVRPPGDDVGRVTQELAHRFEELIRAAPEQWHLLSRTGRAISATNGSGERVVCA